jgi:hypothetical protein
VALPLVLALSSHRYLIGLYGQQPAQRLEVLLVDEI